MKNRKILIPLLMIAGLFLSGLYGPWYAPATYVVLLAALMRLRAGEGILWGGVCTAIVFLVMAFWMKHQDQSGLLEKTGALLGGLSPMALVLVTTIIGGITGLLSAWLGSQLSQVIRGKN